MGEKRVELIKGAVLGWERIPFNVWLIKFLGDADESNYEFLSKQ